MKWLDGFLHWKRQIYKEHGEHKRNHPITQWAWIMTLDHKQADLRALYCMLS
jgi:hypothetical protein